MGSHAVTTSARQRLRVTYRSRAATERSSGGLARTWIEAFEAAGLALARPEGSKRARIELGPPLPQGASGDAEVLDALLASRAEPSAVVIALASVLPDGLEPLCAEEIGEHLPSLQSSTVAASYCATFDHSDLDTHAVRDRIEALLAAEICDREELRGERLRRFDLRPLVYGLRLREDGPRLHLEMRLALTQAGAGRPSSVLDALGISAPPRALVRTGIEVRRPRIAIRAWRERGRFDA